MQHGLFGIEIRRILYSEYLQEIPLTLVTEGESRTDKIINHRVVQPAGSILPRGLCWLLNESKSVDLSVNRFTASSD